MERVTYNKVLDPQGAIQVLEREMVQRNKELADAQATIAALQAERDEYKTMYACLTGETYDNPIADLKAQLTQRTAELEAAKAESNAYYEKAIQFEHELYGDPINNVGIVHVAQGLKKERADLQAELERVRALVKALPKVEGEIEVSSGVYNFILLKHDSGTRFLCGQIETEQTAQAIAALWEHRQGMEG